MLTGHTNNDIETDSDVVDPSMLAIPLEAHYRQRCSHILR